MATGYDLVIIGAGPAGENVAGRTPPGGLSTVIIESELVGATLVGPEAGELVHSATIGIVGEVTLERSWHCNPCVSDDERALASVDGGLWVVGATLCDCSSGLVLNKTSVAPLRRE
jgi:pyruvate/2-oxoglutarate dehydrogenase complex dihydrolipoamide dehydrogenase (E3) component